MFMLDLAKAFDSVSWEFLLSLLEFRGFGPKWREWISALFLTSSTKVLINSALTDQILHRKGLRQGDPLSPLLFVLVVDCLGRLMDTAQAHGVLAPHGTQTVRHWASIYADDVIIFSKPLLSEIDAVSQILTLFGNANGLKTNMVKSKIIPIQCEHIALLDIQTALGCQLI